MHMSTWFCWDTTVLRMVPTGDSYRHTKAITLTLYTPSPLQPAPRAPGMG